MIYIIKYTNPENAPLIAQLKIDIERCKESIEEVKQQLAHATEHLNLFNKLVADLPTAEAAFIEHIELFKTTEVTAFNNAYDAHHEAVSALREANDLLEMLTQLKQGLENYHNYIVGLESTIAQHKQMLSEITNNYEVTISQINAMIEHLNQEIEMQTALVALAKKELDAAIAAQQ